MHTCFHTDWDRSSPREAALIVISPLLSSFKPSGERSLCSPSSIWLSNSLNSHPDRSSILFNILACLSTSSTISWIPACSFFPTSVPCISQAHFIVFPSLKPTSSIAGSAEDLRSCVVLILTVFCADGPMSDSTRRGTFEERVNGLNRVVRLVIYEVFMSPDLRGPTRSKVRKGNPS